MHPRSVSAWNVWTSTDILCSCCSHLAMPAPQPDTWQQPWQEIENSHKVFIRDRIIQYFLLGCFFFFFFSLLSLNLWPASDLLEVAHAIGPVCVYMCMSPWVCVNACVCVCVCVQAGIMSGYRSGSVYRACHSHSFNVSIQHLACSIERPLYV